MIAEIFLPIPINRSFYYKISKSVNLKLIKKGTLVLVNFKNKILTGIIWKTHKNILHDYELKTLDIVFYDIILNEEILNTIQFISNYSSNSLTSILKLFLSGFSSKNYERKILELEKSKNFKIDSVSKKKLILNLEQKNAFQKILSVLEKRKFEVLVLDGVTSSGKTRVYMNVLFEVLRKGLQCLIMVPEKILTKQWIEELKNDFGLKPEIFHSSISKSKRNKIWLGALSGNINIVIGTRSSLFLPFRNLGLIVIDEEHDISFKQEEGTILNIRDLGIVRAKNNNCLIILSSATPSIETEFNCKSKKYTKISLKNRVGNAKLPKIEIIDMKLEKKKENHWISKKLEVAIKKTLDQKQQALIFLNKRGFAPVVICKKCGFSKVCKNCDFSLVLHTNKTSGKPSNLVCHYCNFKEIYSDKCEKCKNEKTFLTIGPGVERIYQEASSLFPKSRIALLSSDSVKSEKNYENILNSIYNNQVDIIIGTQITSKGHHFPNLKTVGIINIDNLLNSFDLRSSEKSFQLLTQVSGRAGRSGSEGNVFIQTFQPDHPVIKSIIVFDKEKFINWELSRRKQNFQPPFSSLISMIIQNKKEQLVIDKSKEIVEILSQKFSEIIIYGPAPALIFKIRNNFRWRILIKTNKNYSLLNDLKKFLLRIKLSSSVEVKIDVDPLSFF
ncbi:MAG: primosomal protein N' [Rickettsiales bacterium]|nr:primosomal protein N' [Rickettsiales bacterium]